MRSASVAGWERKSTLPLAVPLQYSNVYVYAERNSNQRRTRALR